MATSPDFILFAQHGWADTSQEIGKLAQDLATPNTLAIAPDLGWLNTWLRIHPLIETVEKIAEDAIANYPNTPWRIIGHSLGGLIWLEVLHKHPNWWDRVDSLVLVGSPVGGSHLGRIIDNFAMGVGMAQDLAVNRRSIAEAIAAVIPTLTIAGDCDRGSDGTVTVAATKFQNARFVCLPDLHHAAMKNHFEIARVIRSFWESPQVSINDSEAEFSNELIGFLRSFTELTDGHPRDFNKAKLHTSFRGGYTLHTWRNPLGIEHIFIGDRDGKCLYTGFALWKNAQTFQEILKQVNQKFATNP